MVQRSSVDLQSLVGHCSVSLIVQLEHVWLISRDRTQGEGVTRRFLLSLGFWFWFWLWFRLALFRVPFEFGLQQRQINHAYIQTGHAWGRTSVSVVIEAMRVRPDSMPARNSPID